MELRSILTTSGLNTLTFTDPYIKLKLTSLAAFEFKRTVYIDLDTAYSAYAGAGLIPTEGADIYLPSYGRFMACFTDAVKQINQRHHSLVILDSVSSFYSLYYSPEKNIGLLNRLLYVLVMLLLRCGKDLQIPVLVTSMLRYRNDKGWIQSPTARRLVEMKNAVRLSVEKSSEGQAVEILAHPNLEAGTRFEFADLIAWR